MVRIGRFDLVSPKHATPSNHDVSGLRPPNERRRFIKLQNRVKVEIENVRQSEVTSPLARVLEKNHPALTADLFEFVRTGRTEAVLINFNGRPETLQGPNMEAIYWKVLTDVTVERFETTDNLRLTTEQLAALSSSSRHAFRAIVEQNQVGLLFVYGELKEQLPPGRHAYWNPKGAVNIQTVDLRPVPIEVTVQEILTKDRVSIWVTLTAFLQVAEVEKTIAASSDYSTYAYRLIQFALREAVSNRTLDQVLNNRESVDEQVRTYVREHMGDVGLKVTELGLKDVVLPGDMRGMLNRVVKLKSWPKPT